jgi:hypothetical protein
MRLDTVQRNALKTALQHLQTGGQVFLFGSRVDDAKRGEILTCSFFQNNLNLS